MLWLIASMLIFPSQSKAFSHFTNDKSEPIVINAGVGGNTTIDLLKRIDKSCLSHNPTLTVLMVGTNDMNSMKHVPLAEYEKNMIEIITKIKSSGSEIIIMSIPPVYEPYLYTRHDKSFYEPEGFSNRQSTLNNLIKSLAEKYELTYLDMHHIFESVGNIGEDKESLIQNVANSGKTDGLHPTKEGYRIMAVAIYECIVHNNLPTQRVVCFGDSITAANYPAFLRRLLGAI